MQLDTCHLFYRDMRRRLAGETDTRSDKSCCGRVKREDHPVCEEAATLKDAMFVEGTKVCPFCGRPVCPDCIAA